MTELMSLNHPAALFSPDRKYRYVLRRWSGPEKRSCLFICLNPSTADETQDDPTVRRCIGFSERWGFDQHVLCNLFGLRSTDPSGLNMDPSPIGPENLDYIMKEACIAQRVICAWGTHGAYLDQGEEVSRKLRGMGVQLYVLGLTKEGHPKHPLYLPYTARPIPWSGYA